MERIGPTELAALTSLFENRFLATSQNDWPGLRSLPCVSAYQVTAKNPARLLSLLGGTRM